jgi:hypothetical protein
VRIFLSSTYLDLGEHRKAATDALERLGHLVDRMEVMGARPDKPLNECLAMVDQCDLFVAIYAHRYGSVPEGSRVSITEAELERAIDRKKPVFCFVIDDGYPWPTDMIDDGNPKEMLQALKKRVRSTFTTDAFKTPEDLGAKVGTAVGRYLAERARTPRPGLKRIVGIAVSVSVVVVVVALGALLVMKFCRRSETGRVGQQPGSTELFLVGDHYDPTSGLMGDTGDITVERGVDAVTFVYETLGRSPHEWDWKYVDGELNPAPARFAGVMYLNPPNNWGSCETGGFDLREVRGKIVWEARSVQGEVNVEFVIGGIEWNWNNEEGTKEDVPYRDSMPRKSLGVQKLTEQWQEYRYDLSKLPDRYLQCVVAGFGWIASWGSNNVYLNDEGTGPEQPRTLVFQIRNIVYED